MNIFKLYENCLTLSLHDIRLNMKTKEAGRLAIKTLPPTENEDGSYQCRFTFTATTAYLKFNLDGNLVDKADITFDLELNNCNYNEDDGWSWDSLEGYRVIGGHYQPNIISYCGDRALNSSTEGEWYLGGITESQDKSIGGISPSMIVARTNKEQRTEFIQQLVANIETIAET